MMLFHCIISNFEKKNCSIVNKRLFLQKFSVVSFFHKSCVKHATIARQFDQIKHVFKIWFDQSEKSSITDVRLGSKYASVNITLHLTFLKSACKR